MRNATFWKHDSIITRYQVKDIDHCGIVAGICDQMNLVEQINPAAGTHSQEIISAGQVVKQWF